MPALLRFSGAKKRDPAIDRWIDVQPRELGSIARRWFEQMRRCGTDVRELMHDGCPSCALRTRRSDISTPSRLM